MTIHKERVGRWQWEHFSLPQDLLEYLSNYDFLTCPESEFIEIFKHKHKQKKGVAWAKVSWAGSVYFLKSRTALTWSRRLSMTTKKSASRIEWDRIEWMESHGLLSSKRSAVGEVRVAGLLYCDVLLTQWESNALTLRDFHEALCSREENSEKRLELKQLLLFKLGRVMARMHLENCYHRQLHLGNAMVRNTIDDAQFLNIDLKHLSIFDALPLDEWIWSFYVLPKWLKQPVMDWYVESPDFRSLIDGYYSENTAGFSSCETMYESLRAVVSAPMSRGLPKRPKRIDRSWLENKLNLNLEEFVR